MSFSGSDLGDTPPPMISPASIQSDSWANVEAAAVALEGTTAGDKDDFVSVKDERDRLRSRVFELENRLRETEEELEYFSNFYKKIKRENGGLASQAGASSGKQQSSSSSTTAKGASKYDDHATEQRTGEEKTQQPRSDCSDSDLEDGTAPINQNYAEPWSKTLGRNAALEYTRDSPMFRKRLWAFQETLKPLEGYTMKILDRVENYCKAGEAFREGGISLAEELSNKNTSRVMFSKNFKGMGDLAANMASFSSALQQVHDLISMLIDSVHSGLTIPLVEFKEGFRDLDGLSEELDVRGQEYENHLSKALDQKALPTEGRLHDLAARARWDFELYRFDLVRYVNQLDSKKVVLLETGINRAFYALLAFFQGGAGIFGSQEKNMNKRQELLGQMNKRYDGDHALWAYVRSRLQAELQGALPPPGAPPGALAPINPRASCPVYVADLTTEVLSADSQEASPRDTVHCRDEGVLKQGYLMKRQVFGRKERCWYRLHSAKLYTLELRGAAKGDVPTCVFDLSQGTAIAKRPGRIPFCFLLVGDDGYRLELQAESEDEMLKWMAALRRCQRLEGDDIALSKHLGEGGESRKGVGRKTVGLRAEALMVEFRRKNPECAECGSPGIEWASVNIGVTLCGACATVHRTLGNAVSHLRSLKLDQWSVFVLQTLVEDLGNKKARQIWECNVSPGWTKPTQGASAQDREQWIIAKYRWYGFVGDDTRDPPLVSKAMHHAAARGDVERIAWCIAHKGDVNWPDPKQGARTALHVACEADRRRAVAVLLLHGADMYTKNDSGVSAQDMVAQDPHSDVARLLEENERGDLW